MLSRIMAVILIILLIGCGQASSPIATSTYNHNQSTQAEQATKWAAEYTETALYKPKISTPTDALYELETSTPSSRLPELETSTPSSVQSGCPNGCDYHKSGCDIKGNISFDTQEKIYHIPGGYFYDSTTINPAYGERWFCTEEEARNNGWRKSQQ
jgi:hypothetical protein